MNRLSYEDLTWNPVCLRPNRCTIKDGARTPWDTSEPREQAVFVKQELRTAVVRMPAGYGKISDAGYDQMVCLAAAIPVCDHVVFRGTIFVRCSPSAEERNGQEGLGLFFRDTLAPDPLTGYPYSNMIAGGIFRGTIGMVERTGVLQDDIEQTRTVFHTEEIPEPLEIVGRKLEVRLEKHGAGVKVTITREGYPSVSVFEAAVDEDIFSAREPETLYLGFLAARGYEMEIDTDTVSVEYGDAPDDGKPMNVLFVSPMGTCHGDGTAEAPMDLQTAIKCCKRGQEIRVLPGRYRMEKDLVISADNTGSRNRLKKILAESGQGKNAVIDFCGSRQKFRIEGKYWDIGGLTVTGGFGFAVSGSYNRIHDCVAVSNLETGFLIRHPSSDSSKQIWPSYNEISDCVSCLNADESQQNADGFACKIAAGPGNRFIRCTAYLNSDDGFDLFSKNRIIGAVSLVECRSLLNGYTLQGEKLVKTRGNGNGFKLGGSGLPADHEAFDCEAVGNRECGFTSNSNPHMRLFSCLAVNNGRNFAYYFTGLQVQPVFIQENCTELADPSFDPAVWIREHPAFSGIPILTERAADDRPVILIMCSSLYGGGAERVACLLANGLTDSCRVYMLYIQDKGQTYHLDPEVQTIAMPYFECSSYDELTEHRIAYVRQIKESLNAAAAISFMFTMNKLNVMSRGNAKVICSERNSPAKRDPHRIKEIESFYESADHVVFQSEAVRGQFSRKVRENSSIIQNPVSVSCRRTGASHRIVNVARLTLQKNQAMLIRAFAAFHRIHSDYTLSIYGEGELAEELQTLTDSLGLRGIVRFHGQVRNIHEEISDAEIFTLSSDYEGLSNALLECMKMGFPCISTRCEGSVDVIRSGENGLLVDVGSEEQMTAAMTMLADDPMLREKLGIQAMKISEQFRAERVIGQWKQLIMRLMGQRYNG